MCVFTTSFPPKLLSKFWPSCLVFFEEQQHLLRGRNEGEILLVQFAGHYECIQLFSLLCLITISQLSCFAINKTSFFIVSPPQKKECIHPFHSTPLLRLSKDFNYFKLSL